jgi:excisionase family DNA binding protein
MNYLSLTEASEYLGISRPGMWYLIKRKVIRAFKVGNTYSVNKTDVEKYKLVCEARLPKTDLV